MSRVLRIANTSIGMKLLMALSGLVLIGFLVGHLAGNLKMFGGPEDMNSYADGLHQHPVLLWSVRLVLLAAVLVHIVEGLRLWRRNRRARQHGSAGYQREKTLRASLASRHMTALGLVVLAFLVFHLLHFTFRAVANEHSEVIDSMGRRDVFAMVHSAFQNPILIAVYVVGLLAVALHLWHGAPSTPQSLGISHSAYDRALRGGARLVAVLLVLGFIAIPLCIYFGLVPNAG
jgi:succinate dehydrogenase / fumarate reductase cytochrome b subunit